MQSFGQLSIDPSAPNPLGTDDAILMAAVQGRFYGSVLASTRIEALIAAHVPRTHIRDVSEVYRSKWWDYRRLAPGHSFMLFAHHYHKGVAVAARKFVAEQRSRGVRGGNYGKVGASPIEQSTEDLWDRDQSHITGLWKAMLVADALSIPYPEFCRLAFRIAFERLWKRLPRPSQLYSEKLGAYVLDEWEMLQAERLFLAEHPMYAEENYAGLELQDQYRAWLIEHIGKHSDPMIGLMNAVYIKRQLPEALAGQHFPAQTLKRARLLAT